MQIALTSKRLFKILENSRELEFLLKLLFSTTYFTRLILHDHSR